MLMTVYVLLKFQYSAVFHPETPAVGQHPPIDFQSADTGLYLLIKIKLIKIFKEKLLFFCLPQCVNSPNFGPYFEAANNKS